MPNQNYYKYQCCHTQGVQQPHSFHSAGEIDNGYPCPGVQMLTLRIVDASQRFFVLDELVRTDGNAVEEIITFAAHARTQAADSLFPTSTPAVTEGHRVSYCLSMTYLTA